MSIFEEYGNDELNETCVCTGGYNKGFVLIHAKTQS